MYRLKLQELRKAAGYKTQREFAERLGIKERKYASWEREEVALTLEDACACAKALGCSVGDLCEWRDDDDELEDTRLTELNDSFAALSDSGKDSALGAVKGILASESAKG